MDEGRGMGGEGVGQRVEGMRVEGRACGALSGIRNIDNMQGIMNLCPRYDLGRDAEQLCLFSLCELLFPLGDVAHKFLLPPASTRNQNGDQPRKYG